MPCPIIDNARIGSWAFKLPVTEVYENLGCREKAGRLIPGSDAGKITVFEDHFTIDFKSGVTIDIEA